MNKRCEGRPGRSCLMMEAPRWTGITKGETGPNAVGCLPPQSHWTFYFVAETPRLTAICDQGTKAIAEFKRLFESK
jgi:hypothetical protein